MWVLLLKVKTVSVAKSKKQIYILTESIQIFKAATMLNAIW